MRSVRKSRWLRFHEGCFQISMILFCLILMAAFVFFVFPTPNWPLLTYLPLLAVSGMLLFSLWYVFLSIQKRRWLNRHGLVVDATVIEHQTKIIDQPGSGSRNLDYYIHLQWLDPKTTKVYNYCIRVPSLFALGRHPRGSSIKIDLDPTDPSFFLARF